MANGSVEEDIKRIVIGRLEVLPRNKKISIGSAGEFDKDELIERVKKGDDVGKKIIQIEMDFLRSLKEGMLI